MADNLTDTGAVKGTLKRTSASASTLFGPDAGRVPGLRIWRIENMAPKPWPEEQYGKFLSGDSYIVLNSKPGKNGDVIGHDIHFWLGKETSTDEAGAAALMAVALDDSLGGAPVQYREVQQHESKLFCSLFKKGQGLQYIEGGLDSSFNTVTRDEWPTRLLQVKGRRSIRVSQVECSAASLNSGDCFVLDLGLRLFVWKGLKSNMQERVKCGQVALSIRNDERGARAEVVQITQGEEPDDFWGPLGGRADVRNAEDAGDDREHEESYSENTRLYKISDAGGSMDVSEVGAAPLQKSQLDSGDVMLLLAPNGLYVWVGKGANNEEKRQSMKTAQEFIASNNMPPSIPLTRIPEGGETPIFRENFASWPPAVSRQVFGHESLKRHARIARSGGSQIDVSTMQRGDKDAATAARRGSIAVKDDHTGKLTVWRIENFEKKPILPSDYGQFYAGDSYIVFYQYGHGEGIIYFWQGKDSSTDEKGASAILAAKLDDLHGGRPVQVRVVQNHEPQHFLGLFDGKMIVHSGGHGGGFSGAAGDSYDTDGVSLYHVRGAGMGVRTVAVEEKAASLNSGDSFVLLTPETMYTWYGSGANDEERSVAKKVADTLKGERKEEEVKEGEETEAFWSFIGGKGEYASEKFEDEPPRDPRLFQVSNASGNLRAEEVYNFDQTDLIEDDVMILDAYNEVFVWVGKGSNASEKEAANTTARDYVQSAKDGRHENTPIVTVHDGEEPLLFTRNFLGWSFAPRPTFVDPLEERKKTMKRGVKDGIDEEGEISAPGGGVVEKPAAPVLEEGGTYTLEQLKKKPIGLQPDKLESYLSDEEFKQVFGMDKASFEALAGWKKTSKKKEVGLF